MTLVGLTGQVFSQNERQSIALLTSQMPFPDLVSMQICPSVMMLMLLLHSSLLIVLTSLAYLSTSDLTNVDGDVLPQPAIVTDELS